MLDDEIHPDCEHECQNGVCKPNWSDPYGCGGCCQCVGGCYAYQMDKLEEERQRRNPHSIGFNPAGGVYVADQGTPLPGPAGPAEAPEWEHVGHLQPTGITVPAEGNWGDQVINGRIVPLNEVLETAIRDLLEFYSQRMQTALDTWLNRGQYTTWSAFDEAHDWKTMDGQPGTTGALEELVAETIEKYGVQPGGTDTSPAATVRFVSADPRKARKTADTTKISRDVSEVVSEPPSYTQPRKPTKKRRF